MKFIVFYLQFINSLEGLGMFFSSAALIRRLCRYTATTALFRLFELLTVMAADTLFVNNPCHFVVANFWSRILCSLAAEDACFRMRITLGVVLIRSLVFHVCVPECSWNGSGVRPYLWVQEKIVWFRQTSQNAGLCPAKLLGHFFRDFAFILLENLCDIILVNCRKGRVSCLAVPRMFLLCFSCNDCQLSFVSQRCHFWRENATQLWRLN